VNIDENPTVTGSHGIEYIPTTILFKDGVEIDRLIGGLSEAELLDYYSVWLAAPDSAPTVTGFTPTSGPVGTSVILAGSGFGGATAVAFNGTVAATFSVDSGTQITATVPAGATSGTIAVTTPGGTVTSAASFSVTAASAAPSITKLKPAAGKRGATVTIAGSGFGAARGTSSVRFGSKTCAAYLSWSDTQITCKVPAKAKYGAVTVTVTTAAGRSNAWSFTVRR